MKLDRKEKPITKKGKQTIAINLRWGTIKVQTVIETDVIEINARFTEFGTETQRFIWASQLAIEISELIVRFPDTPLTPCDKLISCFPILIQNGDCHYVNG